MGAKAIADDAFSSLSIILREPIEVERLGDRFSYLPLPQRRDLFHPETFLGHATHAIRYVVDLWTNHPHLHPFFSSEEDYHLAVAKFLILVALLDATNEEGYPLYPGYRLLPQSTRAMASFCGLLSKSDSFLNNIAKVFAESSVDFRNAWSSRVARANSSKLGSGFYPRAGVHFPDPMDERVEEW